ncbi:hypothetical protein JX265_003707 [Neoarthrinium moseri]|uniref:Cutinase n=1 Tax=Neoarthrinium moseri TaxID=1658444 RepID=A0A9Q0ATR7_9PEZI|nr:uncharacterized protein JN550_002452 [Neoarthrinium moseri]KAI1875023.1 hypothetical protein JN550_002452 [Neoarthrinium moseri]KAI1877699.1 hypothetical protein JX265_003707 [Neoarthrinium moseri]
MRTGLLAAFAASTVAGASLPLEVRQATTDTCSEVHIFLAKGNNEPYPGRQSKLVAAICHGLASCDYEDIQMNNMLEDEYCGSIHQGATNGQSQIIAYNKRCPDAKLVVSGYSQGAHVVGDIIGGGGGTFFQDCVEPSNPNLDINSDAGKKIAAILTFGDVRHTANEPYNFESGAGDSGLYPRPASMTSNLASYSKVYRDYCVAGDPICAGGKTVQDHLSYFDVFSDSAAEWVKGKLDAATCDHCSYTVTTASATASASGSSPAASSTGAATTTTTEADASSTATSTGASSTATGTGSSSTTGTTLSSATTSFALPEGTAATTANLAATPTSVAPAASASASGTGNSAAGSSLDQQSMSVFGLAIAAAFAVILV